MAVSNTPLAMERTFSFPFRYPSGILSVSFWYALFLLLFRIPWLHDATKMGTRAPNGLNATISFRCASGLCSLPSLLRFWISRARLTRTNLTEP